nr:MAG: hypothetical protein DIU57_21255 [Pseudomonadota bacterium]
MRLALEAMKRDQSPMEHIRDALKTGKSRQSVKASILARRLLKDLDAEQKESLRSRIGDKAYNVLLSYDRVLEGWAAAL